MQCEQAQSMSMGMRHNINFGDVEVKKYEIIAGDNPACTSGAPVGIGWSSSDVTRIDLDAYEADRPPRRKRGELMMSSAERRKKLEAMGISNQEIVKSIRGVERVKAQRNRTQINLKMEPAQEKLQKVIRGAKRVILRRKSCQEQFGPWLQKTHLPPQSLDVPLGEDESVGDSDISTSSTWGHELKKRHSTSNCKHSTSSDTLSTIGI